MLIWVQDMAPFYGFWTVNYNGSRPLKDPTPEYQYNRNWKFLMYVSQRDLTEETKLRYLKYMGGQGIFLPRKPKALIYWLLEKQPEMQYAQEHRRWTSL